MAVVGARVTVTTAATALFTADTDNVSGQAVVVRNAGGASVDLGGSGVTSGAGYELAASAVVTLNVGAGETLYAIAASSTVRVDVLRLGA